MNGLYEVSNFGKVRNYKNKRILKPFKTGNNEYLRVKLSKNNKGKDYTIHRLVANNFILNPNNFSQVNHIDEDKTNNKVNNLEWCTHSYNQNYGKRNEIVAKKLSKKILQYDLNGNFIKEWSSASEYYKSINKRVQPGISMCCKNIRKSAYGYIWRYAYE